jgi:hypothetical protein
LFRKLFEVLVINHAEAEKPATSRLGHQQWSPRFFVAFPHDCNCNCNKRSSTPSSSATAGAYGLTKAFGCLQKAF